GVENDSITARISRVGLGLFVSLRSAVCPAIEFPLSLAVGRGAVHNRAAVLWECSTALHRFRISFAISSELQREEEALDGIAIISIIACGRMKALPKRSITF